MNMNGGTSTSATDPHHRSIVNSAYLGMGIPGLGTTPMTPSTGNGFGGASLGGLGMSGAVGPELKHHADFLSRLLAATPSYPSEIGNPPPGFFSDWLRRLVSKPGPGNGNSSTPHHHHHRGRGSSSPHQNMSSPPGSGTTSTASIQQQTSSLTFSPPSGQAESNGVSALESPTTQTGNSSAKRRKRTRISDHHLHLPHQQHHSGKDPGASGRESSPSPLSSHLNHNQPNSLGGSALTSTLSPGSSSSSAVAAAAAAASLNVNPFTHPLWFFPPFLPNPYLSPMNMNMGNFPLLPPHGVPPPPPGSTSAPPYLSQSSESLLSSFRSENLLHAHHRSFNTQPPDLNLNTMNKKDQIPEAIKNSHSSQSHSKKSCSSKTSSKKSSSFSISRLTSPSPSSNSSGGSLTSKNSSNNNNNNNQSGGETTGKTASLALGPGMMMGRIQPNSKRDKAGNSDSGSETGASNCVDLRVSGRIWEKSGVAPPPPRSIYKPLSAFHDPADVNLTHSSQHTSPDNFTSTGGGTTTKCLEQEQKMISGESTNLSTTYVLKNLHHIYLRVRERVSSSSSEKSFIQSCTPINNTTGRSRSSSPPPSYKNHQFSDDSLRGEEEKSHVPPSQPRNPHSSFNYSDSEDSNNESNHLQDEKKRESKIIDLVEASSFPSTVSGRKIGGGGEKKIIEPEIKIPFPRPIKVEPNYNTNSTSSNSGIKGKRGHTSSSVHSFDGDEDEEKRSKVFKFRTNDKNSFLSSDNEEDEDDDIVNVLSDISENEDDPSDCARKGNHARVEKKQGSLSPGHE